MSCPDCERIPGISESGGCLLLAPPLSHTRARLRRELHRTMANGVELLEDGVLAVEVREGELEALLLDLHGQLSEPELTSCRSCFLETGEVFGYAALARMTPLSVPVARARGRWLADTMLDGRLTSFFQPIVHGGEPGRIFAYEALLRGETVDGTLIGPQVLFGAARAADMLFQLDRQARLTAIEQTNRLALQTPIFINFNPTAIYDAQFCLRTTMEAARESGRAAGQFVFEVVESDAVNDMDHLIGILQEYRANGFRVALDDVGAAYGSLDMLRQIQPDFVKIDRNLVAEIPGSPAQQSIVKHLVGIARDLGIQVVAEGIEQPSERDWLRALGVDYLQGFLFGRPQPTP